MNANENLGKKRKNAVAIVEMGVALISSSIVLFLITLFYFYVILIPAFHDPMWGPLEALITIAIPLFVEVLIFVSSFILLLIGLCCCITVKEVFAQPGGDETFEQKREDAIGKLGQVLMSVSLVLFIITLFGFYAKFILSPLDPFFLVEAMIFVHGLVMLLIGLLKMQKEKENLEQKRKGAIAIGKLGAVLMSIGIIPLIYFYAIVNPARGPFGGIPSTVLDPLFIGTVLFVLGLIVILIGLLSPLIGRLKKQESL